MAAPTLRIGTIAGQSVSTGQDATITPATPMPWNVVGTVQHENNKPVTAMWYQVGADPPQSILVPPDAGLPGHTAAVEWSFSLAVRPNGDYAVSVYALNEDGVAQNDQYGSRVVHYVGFSGPGPGPGPGPNP